MLRRKYRKIYYFLVSVKKEFDNNKTIMYKLKFIDILDLSQPHYQVLLINYLKLTKKNAKDVKKKEKSNQYPILLVLKIMN